MRIHPCQTSVCWWTESRADSASLNLWSVLKEEGAGKMSCRDHLWVLSCSGPSGMLYVICVKTETTALCQEQIMSFTF